MFDHFRRAALEQAYLAELALIPEAEQPSPEMQHLILEDLKAIDRLLGKLSSKARAAFLHSRLDGMGHAEIAERLGVSVSRVRQYIAQGMRQCYVALYGSRREQPPGFVPGPGSRDCLETQPWREQRHA